VLASIVLAFSGVRLRRKSVVARAHERALSNDARVPRHSSGDYSDCGLSALDHKRYMLDVRTLFARRMCEFYFISRVRTLLYVYSVVDCLR